MDSECPVDQIDGMVSEKASDAQPGHESFPWLIGFLNRPPEVVKLPRRSVNDVPVNALAFPPVRHFVSARLRGVIKNVMKSPLGDFVG